MNTKLLEKWVAKFMSSWEDLVTQVLKESYDRELNWERYTVPFQGASSFWKDLRHIFWRIEAFFVAHLGNSSAFQYWTDDWLTRGILSETFPR